MSEQPSSGGSSSPHAMGASLPKPSVGRIVHYTFPAHEQPPNHSNPVPAIITCVFSDDCVNLRIFADQEPKKMEWRTSVLRKKQYDDTDCWEFPPRV